MQWWGWVVFIDTEGRELCCNNFLYIIFELFSETSALITKKRDSKHETKVFSQVCCLSNPTRMISGGTH